MDSLVAAPGPAFAEYEHDGFRILRFPVKDVGVGLDQLYGGGDGDAAAEFGRLLDRERPDIVHQHAFTYGASVLLVREARRRGIRVVFTYHTPTVSCQRGTLLHWGEEVCDGRLDVRRCASCTLQGLGLERSVGQLLGLVPPAIGRTIGRAGLQGGAWTALRMTDLVALRHSAVRALMNEVNRVVVLCDWTRDILLRNEVSPDKITLSPHGLARSTTNDFGGPMSEKPSSRVLRAAFLGRFDRTKGPDVVIEAVRSMPDLPIVVDFYGIAQEGGDNYIRTLHALAAGDSRLTFLDPVPNGDVVSLLRSYDVLVVPSQWLETGPLVVLEAFAAGIPVIGSNLGGIAELVHHGVDGLLVDRRLPGAWADVLKKLADDRAFLRRLHDGVRPPRSMQTVAVEMVRVYREVLESTGRIQDACPEVEAHAPR